MPLDRRLFLQRRGLISDLFPGFGDNDPNNDGTSQSTDPSSTSTTSASSSTSSSTDQGIGGVIGGITSDIGAATSAAGSIVNSILSPILPPSSPTSASSPSIATLTPASVSSPSTSATSTTSSSSSSSSSATPDTTDNIPTPTPDQATQASAYVVTTDGVTTTITRPLDATSSVTATSTPPKSFLQNKALSGTVFGVAGFVVLILIVILSTLAVRKRQRNRLERDAELFNETFPDDGLGTDPFTGEKRRGSGDIAGDIARSASKRLERTSVIGSDEGLLGSGYVHSRTVSDSNVSSENAIAPRQDMQMGMGMGAGVGAGVGAGMNMGPPMMGQIGQPIAPNAYAPGALRGGNQAYPYENLQRSYTSYDRGPYPNIAPMQPSAAYLPAPPQRRGPQAPGSVLPSPWDTVAPIAPPFAQQHQHQGSQGSQRTQDSYYVGENNNGYGSPVPRNGSRGTNNTSANPPSPTSTSTKSSTTGATPSDRDVRPLSDVFGSNVNARSGADASKETEDMEDAYADFAYATGPNQHSSEPRPLKIANA